MLDVEAPDGQDTRSKHSTVSEYGNSCNMGSCSNSLSFSLTHTQLGILYRIFARGRGGSIDVQHA